MNVQEFREKNPQYNDLSNSQLGFGLWKKHYKDDMNAWEFAETFGLNVDDVSEMRTMGLDSGLSEVDIAGDLAKADKDLGISTSVLTGQTLGLGSEVQALVHATEQKLTGSDQDWGDLYDKNKSYFRSNLEAYRNQYPMDALKTEVMGAVSSPLGAVKLTGRLGELPTGFQAMLRGFTEGTLYGVNDSQDKSLAKGLEVGVLSSFFTGGTDRLLRSFKPTSKTVKSMMTLRKNPTVENLKLAKIAAYKEVDAMGGLFDRTDIQKIWESANVMIRDKVAYNPVIDKTVKAIEVQLRKYIANNKMFKLSELDNLRKNLFKRQTNANANEQVIIGRMINTIDDVINNKPIEGAAMKLARGLHRKFMKTKQLDDAFSAARRSTEKSGTGGNLFNNYKAAVVSILNSPKKSRFFTEIELTAMEKFVQTKPTESMLRILSKASPNGNGLIFFLTATAATMNPAALSLTAAGYAGKRAVDKGIQRKAGQLIEDIGEGIKASMPSSPLPVVPTVSAVTTGSPVAFDNPAEGLMNNFISPKIK
ncbi:MAG: hypothetical protein ABGY11_11970 [Candidatus Thioglobus sp.]